MESSNFENSIFIAEQNKIEKDLETLRSTQGFKNLTERQQRIIQQSLYIQARAERGTDEASANAIISPKTHATEHTTILPEDHLQLMHDQNDDLDPKTRKYRSSQNHVASWYCHAAIANLEQEKAMTEPKKLPDNFFKAEYHKLKNFNDLKKQIIDFGFPCVLHVSLSPEIFNDSPSHKHSCLVLGLDSQGIITVWEKQGFGLPYRVTSLEEIYNTYGKDYYGYYWGTRKLNSPNNRQI